MNENVLGRIKIHTYSLLLTDTPTVARPPVHPAGESSSIYDIQTLQIEAFKFLFFYLVGCGGVCL